MTNEEIWEAALGEIELSISPASFTTWFKNTFILSVEDGRVLISVPNGFAKEWLENKYNLNISKALRNFIEDIKEIRCIVSLSDSPSPKRDLGSTTSNSNQKDGSLSSYNKPLDAGLSQTSAGTEDGQINLSLRYTFDNFIVGANNELARAACEAVAKNLGQAYNPLFIYGGVGLGKTHLLQSIGNYILAKDPSRKILYSTSEYFTNRFIDMVKNQQAREFKQSYLDADLLIIDDIQFIAGKEKTQEEFFHIFNTLYQLNKQVVLSSDRPPKSIATLEERLRSRFEGGMIADISRPDLETRIAILRHKAAEKGFEADEDVFTYIANNIQHNIRELEGALNRVIVSCQLKQVDPTLANTKKILSDIISSGKKRGISFKQIAQAVADFYDIHTQELINRSRRKDIVKPRQIAMYLMRSELKASYPGIGEQLGGRDHTTAMHAYEKISHELEQDEQLEQEINVIKNKIYNAG
jgi:chromosomal replication initiator protein